MNSSSMPMPTLRVVDPRRVRRQRLWLLSFWLFSIALAYVIGRYVMIPDAGGLRAALQQSRTAQAELRQRLGETEQRLINIERAEQIARMANENIQAAIVDKDVELGRLRRDLALYERLIGAEAERQGLSVHEVALRPAPEGGSVAFSVIVTQTRDLRSGTVGRLTLSVEGQRDGRLERLDWPDLVPAEAAEGLSYDFRYFQRVEGRILLPEGFQPLTVHVLLVGRGGERSERSVRWEQALAGIVREPFNAAAGLRAVARSAAAGRIDVVFATPSPSIGPLPAPRCELGAVASNVHEQRGPA